MSVIIIISLFWRCCMSREVMADEANLVTSSPLACKFTPVPDTFKASIFMSHISAKRQDSSTLRWVPVTLHRTSPDYSCFFSEMKEKPHGKCVRSTEVFPCFFLSCKANARVKLAEMGHGPHSSKLVVICVVLLLFMCKCVLYYYHWVTTQLQLTHWHTTFYNTWHTYKYSFLRENGNFVHLYFIDAKLIFIDFNTCPCCAVMLGWSLNCVSQLAVY